MSGKAIETDFARAAHPTQTLNKPNKKRPSPLSIRVSDDERAQLRQKANGGSVNAYVRRQLFGAHANRRAAYTPSKIDQQQLASVLAALGKSRLSQNLNQISKNLNMQTMPVTPELLEELHSACAEIATMRQELIAALGLKRRGRS